MQIISKMKLTKYDIAIVLILIFGQIGKAQGGLDQYMTIGAENNPGLKAKFSEYMAALEKVPQVGALPDPTLAFGYFIQPIETRVGPQKAKLSASQMFPWFGTLNSKQEVACELAKTKYEAFQEAKSKLFYEIKSTWYNLYFTRKAIMVMRDNIEIINTFKNLALIKIESGKTSAVDELRVEMEVLDLENQLLQLIDNLSVQKVTFNNLLHEDVNTEIDIPNDLKVKPMTAAKEAILDSIKLNNHQVLQLEFREASYMYQQKVAKKMGKPSFSVGVDYIITGKSSNSMLAPGEVGQDAFVFPKIGITIPLYRKKYTSLVKEVVFMQDAVENKKLDKVNVLETIYERAFADYTDAQRQIELHKKQRDIAKKALRILESEYATEGRNFEEILRMERQVLRHSLELEKSKSDLNASTAFIHYLMGK